jgi:hypothetical protein
MGRAKWTSSDTIELMFQKKDRDAAAKIIDEARAKHELQLKAVELPDSKKV